MITSAKVVAVPEMRDASPLDSLTRFLGATHVLVLLDNCEHLLAGAARGAAHLVARCPGPVLLATRREPLRIAGEWTVPVQPLPLPDPPASLDTTGALHYDAVRLFVERAQAAEPSFRLTDTNAPAVSDI